MKRYLVALCAFALAIGTADAGIFKRGGSCTSGGCSGGSCSAFSSSYGYSYNYSVTKPTPAPAQVLPPMPAVVTTPPTHHKDIIVIDGVKYQRVK